MKKLHLNLGTIKSQTVEIFKLNQPVFFTLGNDFYKGKILGVNGEIAALLMDDNDESEMHIRNLRRLIITDGVKIAPLQHEDWDEALNQKLVDSDIEVKYFIIERKGKTPNSLIRLGRLYKHNEKERSIAKLAFEAGVMVGQYKDTKTFDEYWKETYLELEVNEN